MSETARHSSFENAMEEVAENLNEGEESSVELEELEGYPFTSDFVAAFLSDSEEADLDAIVGEIKMMADEQDVSAASLFFKILREAIKMDDNKNKSAVDDGLIDGKEDK